ncbi:MAG: hypothetical protein KDD56_08750 [Bdellovibrionales bacterium]|nr:hypothetical protein [Bdellovibrionales bacterium]
MDNQSSSSDNKQVKFPSRKELEKQNLLFQAQNSTPLERLKWLENQLRLFHKHILRERNK